MESMLPGVQEDFSKELAFEQTPKESERESVSVSVRSKTSGYRSHL